VRRLAGPPAPLLTFHHDGKLVQAVAGDTVASALLAQGHDVLSRSVKYHRPRGPFCLTGRCAQCFVRVDGVPGVAACTTPVTEGMRVESQNAYPSAKHDVLKTIDWLFPKGLDHHAMFLGVPLSEAVVSTVARHLAGFGPLPDAVHLPEGTAERGSCEVLVVGAGPSGLACAEALRGRGAAVVVVEDGEEVGGRLQAGLDASGPDSGWALEVRRTCEEAGVVFHLRASVLGIYLEEGRRLALVRTASPERLVLLDATHIALCTGTTEPLVPFVGNDLPGVFAGRGLARLIRRHKVLPGSRCVVVGDCAEAVALCRLLAESGAELVGLVDPSGTLEAPGLPLLSGFHPVRATSNAHAHLDGLEIENPQGQAATLSCDLVALCGLPSPATPRAHQLGASVAWRTGAGGFYVSVGPRGETTAKNVFAAGDVAGPTSAALAQEQGRRLGEHLASGGGR